MTATGVRGAREAYARKAWAETHRLYDTAAAADLDLDDIERAATAAHLLCDDPRSREWLALGYRESVRTGEVPRAARFAFWIGHTLMFEGAMSESAGWHARARQLLNQREECVELGYLLLPDGIKQIFSGEYAAARETIGQARAIARRFGDLSLLAMTGHGMGRALVRLGEVEEGMTLLDSVMVSVTADEVSPMVVGEVYCGVLEACREVFDLRRAREWTAALTRWCDGQPELVAHRGPCMVYRAEVMQFHGDWDEAFAEARRACEWLAPPAAGEGGGDAYYRLGELHRLRGDYPRAEEAYRQASRLGRQPEPGLQLLWHARGQELAARTALRRALEETRAEPAKHATILDAHIQLSLAAGETTTARTAAQTLGEIAGTLGVPYLKALALHWEGAILLAEDRPGDALGRLRAAWSEWQKLDAPYESARVRALIGDACHALGDHQSAALEWDAARWCFERLGARPDLERLAQRDRPAVRANAPAGLSERELDVLRLVTAGLTNREIGAELVISEHTVARHVQNMLAKVGCSTRAALAAFAAENGLSTHTGQS
jgi:DNA-binding CsgD family transcriptional regulator